MSVGRMFPPAGFTEKPPLPILKVSTSSSLDCDTDLDVRWGLSAGRESVVGDT